MSNSNSERVVWLETAWGVLREKFLPDAPELAAVTIGFPFKAPTKHAGECWYGWHDENDQSSTFISLNPILFPQPLRILETMLHEMVHVVLGKKEGHKKKFAKKCADLGFDGPPTGNWAGAKLREQLEAIAEELGPVPPGRGEFEVKPVTERKGSRMRKYTCPCGQIIRAAKDGLKVTHVDCGKDFEQQDPPDDPEAPPAEDAK